MTGMFFLYQNVALFLYACLKAFLPLPSLEVVLLPLCLKLPAYWLFFCVIGSFGTMLGGAVGYFLAWRFGRKILQHLASTSDIDKGERLMKRYGIIAVIIGGITPIPDFLLAYLAGLMRMPLFPFLLSDGIARFMRSLLVCYDAKEMAMSVPLDRFLNWLSLLIIVYFLWRWWRGKRQVAQACRK